MRILIVDDEPSILELLKAFLEAAEAHEVTTALSGAEALALIEEADADFECVLLDIQMPEMNGIVLCEKIRALPDYAHVPIIMLTAMSQKTYIDKAFAVGATDYVTKPFDFMDLRGRLQAATQIVQEWNRACDSTETARRLLRDLGQDPKPHPDEALSIDGVERVVGYAAFENYVLTLSRTKLLFASTFAVQIAGFRALHQSIPAREMRAILKSVAEAISDHLADLGNLISYRGNGVFLCVNQKKSGLSPEQREMQINQLLAMRRVMTLGKVEVRAQVGQEVSLVSISRAGALMALRRAVDSLDSRPIPPKELATLSKRVLRNQMRSQEQSKLERRAYEMVLEDIVREEGRRAI
jgi:DNA-binding response OmpR family regulator